MCSPPKVVGFNAITVAAIAYHLAIIVPGIQSEMADAFALILGGSWRVLLGTFASYVLGSLLNSYLMAGLKRRFDKYLVFRRVIFTVAGETVDSCVFHSVAFVGVYAPEVILVMIGSQILFKTLYEIVMYPITRKVLLAVRKHAGLNGLRSQARRFVSFPTVLKWGSEGNRNPI